MSHMDVVPDRIFVRMAVSGDLALPGGDVHQTHVPLPPQSRHHSTPDLGQLQAVLAVVADQRVLDPHHIGSMEVSHVMHHSGQDV